MREAVTVDLVIENVVGDLRRRSQLGVKKYGTTLSSNSAPLVERLQHAYEEALDLANYLKWSIMQLGEQPKSDRLTNECTYPECNCVCECEHS